MSNFEQVGRDAFHADESCIPIANALVSQAIDNLPVGTGAAQIFRAFTQGWHTANLAAPVEGID